MFIFTVTIRLPLVRAQLCFLFGKHCGLCQRFVKLRVATYRQRNFLLMVAMHDYYYCILTGASPLQHKDKVPAEGAAR